MVRGMTGLIDDRYVPLGGESMRDLATGRVVRITGSRGRGARGVASNPALVDLLDHGCDGRPRWVVADLSGASAASAIDRAAEDACVRGYIPVALDVYVRRDPALDEVLRDRALLLIASSSESTRVAREAFVSAAAANPRPHVLLTVRADASDTSRTIPRPATASSVVREARAVYGASAAVSTDASPFTADVARHLARAGRVDALLAAGSHAAAERLLRDVAGALRRRNAAAAEAAVLLTLGNLLLDRGRATAAERVCAEAADAAMRGASESLVVDARIGQALARLDLGQLTAAEAICRALAAAGGVTVRQRATAHALLARVLIQQDRIDETIDLDLTVPDDEPAGVAIAFVDDAAVEVLIGQQNVLAAGRRARASLERRARSGETRAGRLASAIAHRAHLRVVGVTGDPRLIEVAACAALSAARAARAPLQIMRTEIVWAQVLARSGAGRAWGRLSRRLARMRSAVPPLLRAEIDRLTAVHADPPPVKSSVGSGDAARVLVHISHERDDDREAIAETIAWVASRVQASRVDLWSCSAGPAGIVLTSGGGAATTLGPRVLDTGITIGPEPSAPHEVAVPVRLGASLLAALSARWPADRTIPAQGRALWELAAAVIAPRVERLQATARETAVASTAVPDLVGISEGIAAVRRAIARAAAAPFAVLIEGESGCGKELVARAIHALSPRRERRFCDLNCAALTDDLVDAELFGHARGSFTGAVADRSGLFEDADGGTLFLDELPDLSLRAQAKLLRVLQEQEVRRVGETFGRKVDVRIVTATNRDLRVEAAAARFRQDLLYRLDVIRIRIPPLRDRPEDVGVLAEHFWKDAAARVGTHAVLTHAVLAALSRYAWPGNVRELQNVIAALAVAAPAHGRVAASLLPSAIAGQAPAAGMTLAEARDAFERRFVEAALARADGRRARAARDLGLSRQGLLKLLARLRISSNDEENDAGLQKA
jgi:DNA-binding NtrC family response regulator